MPKYPVELPPFITQLLTSVYNIFTHLQNMLPKPNKFKTSKLAQSELAQHNPLTNWTLRKICLLELRFMRWNKLAGLTAFCLAVKK